MSIRSHKRHAYKWFVTVGVLALWVAGCSSDTAGTLDTSEVSGRSWVKPSSLGSASTDNTRELSTKDKLVPRFGEIKLRPNFMPDPHVVNGDLGGDKSGREFDRACRGWVREDPDFMLLTSGRMRRLRIMAHASVDTTLILQREDGTYACNDDERTSRQDPMLLLDLPAGRYPIWVGRFRREFESNYLLGISEFTEVNPGSLTRTTDGT